MMDFSSSTEMVLIGISLSALMARVGSGELKFGGAGVMFLWTRIKRKKVCKSVK